MEAAGVRLRRASLAAALAATRSAVEVVTVSPTAGSAAGSPRLEVGPARAYRPRPRVVAPPAGTTRDRLRALTGVLAPSEPPAIVGPVEAAAAADALLDFLTRAGYLTR